MPWSNELRSFTALRYFALNGTDHATNEEQAGMIHRYVIWRNNHAYDERLRRVVTRQTLPEAALGTRAISLLGGSDGEHLFGTAPQ